MKGRRNVRTGDIVKNAPNALIFAVCFVFVAIIAAFTILSAVGADTTELRSFLNLVLNVAATALAGTGVVVAGSAAKSAQNAERQTNGLADAERRQIAVDAAREALKAAESGDAPSR
jgi:hypothetical protein